MEWEGQLMGSTYVLYDVPAYAVLARVPAES